MSQERSNVLERRFPSAVGIYQSPLARFEVYRAKDLHRERWNSPVLKGIVAMARESYGRYGKRPLFDAYDGKAVIYAVRVLYKVKNSKAVVEEWLSIRLVPGDGLPLGVGEPEVFEHEGIRADELLRRKVGAGGWGNILSSSRMCGIHPYSRRPDGTIVFLEDEHHKFTALCFALIHHQFLTDYPLEKFPYYYMTSIIRSDFHKKGLKFSSGKGDLWPRFTPAHKFLGVPRKNLRAQRTHYTYAFPLYWLHSEKLLRLVNGLRKKEKKLPLRVLESAMFDGLAKKTKAPVLIAGIRICPASMRALIDQNVPDAPELKITKTSTWSRGIQAIIRAAGIKAV